MAELYTKGQITEFAKAFKLFDKAGKGVLSIREISKTMAALGQVCTEEEIISMIKEVNPDGDNTLDFKQFLNLMARKERYTEMEQDYLFFEIMDVHEKGFLTEEVVRHIFTNVGDTFTDEQVDEWLKEADYDGDGLINKDDFVRMMKSL